MKITFSLSPSNSFISSEAANNSLEGCPTVPGVSSKVTEESPASPAQPTKITEKTAINVKKVFKTFFFISV